MTYKVIDNPQQTRTTKLPPVGEFEVGKVIELDNGDQYKAVLAWRKLPRTGAEAPAEAPAADVTPEAPAAPVAPKAGKRA